MCFFNYYFLQQVCKCYLLRCGEHELAIRRVRECMAGVIYTAKKMSIETIWDISVSICIGLILTTILQNIYITHYTDLECCASPGSIAEINYPKYNKQINWKPVPIFSSHLVLGKCSFLTVIEEFLKGIEGISSVYC